MNTCIKANADAGRAMTPGCDPVNDAHADTAGQCEQPGAAALMARQNWMDVAVEGSGLRLRAGMSRDHHDAGEALAETETLVSDEPPMPADDASRPSPGRGDGAVGAVGAERSRMPLEESGNEE